MMRFKIASSPYTHHQRQTAHVMRWVIFACLPGLISQVIFFGYGVLVQVCLAVLTALIAEGGILKLRKMSPGFYLRDNSAALTAVLLGLCLPPLSPWWMIVLGTLFAIVVAKQLYGGLGNNIFNPAMIGYVVLLISFPVQMTSWLPPLSMSSVSIDLLNTLSIIFSGHLLDLQTLSELLSGVDGISQATPLDAFKTARHAGQLAANIQDTHLAWQGVNLAFLAGGGLLLLRNIIQWQIPVSFLLGLSGSALLGWWLDPQQCATPLFHLLSGATMLGAFFIATDPVTASTTPLGRLIFGSLAGILVWLIRTYGGYPDGVAFAILLVNMLVPLIDHYTQPRVYGHR